jgi:ligand-binding sensor domain-containing protein/signal transduction histidine kinase
MSNAKNSTGGLDMRNKKACRMLPQLFFIIACSSKAVFFAAFVFFCISGVLHAQPRQAGFKRYAAAEGLESNHINCLWQDHRGFLWVGTISGLYRFDGYTFRAFKRDPADSTSLSDNIVNVLYEDPFNVLWIGTTNGLNVFDHRTEKFTHYRNEQAAANIVAANFIQALWGDARGTIWIGTHGGVHQFDRTTRKFSKVELTLHGPPGPEPLDFPAILGDDGNTFWLGTFKQGLLKFDAAARTLEQYLHNPADPRGLGSNNILAIYKSRNGTIWVGTHKGGLARISREQKPITAVEVALPDRQTFQTIGAIIEDAEGILWLGTSGAGLIAYDPKTGQYEIFKSDPAHPQRLGSDWILCQYIDRAGNLWIGTTGGLHKLQSPQKKIGHIKKIPGDSNGLIHNNVNALWEDRRSNLWVGTAGGLSVFDAESKLSANYTHDPNDNTSLSLNFVQAISEDKNGNVWVGTFGGGLNKFNRASRRFTRFHEDSTDAGSLSQNFVTAIYEDRAGDLWIGTLGGLNKLDRGQNRFIRYLANAKNPRALSHNGITCMLEDRSGRFWIGTYGGGLNQLQPATGEFTHYKNDRSNPHSLSDDIVSCIYEDESGGLWIGTNAGLNKFDSAAGQFQHYLEQDGLPNNSVLGILGDGDGNLWISTHNGLCKFNDSLPTGQKFLNFDAGKDGLQSNEFNTNAFHRSRSGEFFFGGPNGFNHFFPLDLKAKSPPPAVAFTGFNKLNKPAILDTSIVTTASLELSHNDIFFSFEFAALDFTLPEKNEYAYKMEGFNTDWIYCGNQHQATFTNLDPGSYVFRVKGANSDGVWNETGTALRVTITPPFWQRWWFRLAVAGGILLLVYELYRLRLARVIEVERLRVRIASDLHDDIGATLTKISLYSDLIQTGTNPETSKDLLQKIGAMSRELVTTMSDVVWSIDARNDTVGDLVDRMRDFANGACALRQIEMQFEEAGMEPHKKLRAGARQNIYLIFKEAVNNAVKHAAASKLYVSLQNGNGTFKMKIADDGKGFNAAPRRTGHGLRNMQMRAERIGARLDVKMDGGVAVTLEAKVF